MKYRTILRPAHGGGLPSGVKWEYVEAPSGGAMGWLVNRPDLPVSKYRYGVIKTDRPLTKEEMEHFDIESVDDAFSICYEELLLALPAVPDDWPPYAVRDALRRAIDAFEKAKVASC